VALDLFLPKVNSFLHLLELLPFQMESLKFLLLQLVAVVLLAPQAQAKAEEMAVEELP
jgi:hypothetical protein